MPVDLVLKLKGRGIGENYVYLPSQWHRYVSRIRQDTPSKYNLNDTLKVVSNAFECYSFLTHYLINIAFLTKREIFRIM